MKKLLLTLALIVSTLLLTACGGGEKEEKAKADDGKVTVGYVINNLNDTFQTFILDAAQKYANENGIELIVENAKEDVIKQQDLVHSLIERDVDALIVIPTDTSAMQPITDAAVDAKIPLSYVNRNPYSGNEAGMAENVYYVGADEISGGIMQMEYVGEKLGGKGNIAILMGILGNEGALKRTEGVNQVISEKYPDVKVLAEETALWQRDKGMAVTENWITTYGDKLNAIIANNDEMALGTIEALRSNGLLDKVVVVGLDATPDALNSVEKGEMAATIFQDAAGQGKTAIEILNKVIKGEEVKEKVTYIPFKLVTKENLAEFK
jgi:inositol transport system substrate-binding protein